MSYDISLLEPVSDEVIELKDTHQIRGGTYQAGGSTEARLNITYNYGGIYRKIFGDEGIRTLYGLSGAESISLIEKAIKELEDNTSPDYWEATEGNAKKALYGLLAFARLRPDGVWDGD